MKNLSPKPRLSLVLEDDSQGLPLDQLLEQALAVLAGRGTSTNKTRHWFARQALRAVCEAVLRDGRAAFPLAVDIQQAGFRSIGRRQPAPVRQVADNVVSVNFHAGSAA